MLVVRTAGDDARAEQGADDRRAPRKPYGQAALFREPSPDPGGVREAAGITRSGAGPRNVPAQRGALEQVSSLAASSGPSAEGVTDYRPCGSCRGRGFALAGEFAYGCMRCEHTSVVLEVLGAPAPKGSYRAISRGGFAQLVPSGSDSRKRSLKSWDVNVREAALELLGRDRKQPLFVDQALHVAIVFRLARPKGHWSAKGGLRTSAPAHPFVKPDLDKLTRQTLDSLTGLVYDDDARIAKLSVEKAYARPGHDGASIMVTTMSALEVAQAGAEALEARIRDLQRELEDLRERKAADDR